MSAGRRALVSATVLLVGLAAAEAHAGSVLVIPITPEANVPRRRAELATEALLKTLGEVQKRKVLDADRVSKELGVELSREAGSCARDVICLVQLGEAVEASHLLIGDLHVRDDASFGLRVTIVDIAKASKETTTLVIPPNAPPTAVGDAARFLARQSFATPDTRVRLVVEPPSARITIFGEPFGAPPYADEVQFWSGTYYAHVEAEGHKPKDLEIVVPPGSARVEVVLDPDLLYVKKSSTPRATLGPSGTEAAVDTGPSIAANLPAWLTIGAGAAGVGIGAYLMAGAQADYNSVSAQDRFSAAASDVVLAEASRASDRSTFTIGSGLLIGGSALVAGGFAWMLIEGLVGRADPSTAPAEANASCGPFGARGVSCTFGF